MTDPRPLAAGGGFWQEGRITHPNAKRELTCIRRPARLEPDCPILLEESGRLNHARASACVEDVAIFDDGPSNAGNMPTLKRAEPVATCDHLLGLKS